MFDAKSILDILVGGGQPQAQRQPSGGGMAEISDLLKQLAGADQERPGGAPGTPRRPPIGRDYDEDEAPPPRRPSPQAHAPREEDDMGAARGPQGGGGLEDILREVLGGGRGGGAGGGLGDILRRMQTQGGPGSGGGQSGGGLGDILGEILGGGR